MYPEKRCSDVLQYNVEFRLALYHAVETNLERLKEALILSDFSMNLISHMIHLGSTIMSRKAELTKTSNSIHDHGGSGYKKASSFR